MKILGKSLEIALQLHSSRVVKQEYNVYAFLYDKNKLLSIGINDMTGEHAKVIKLAKRFKVGHFQKFPNLHAEIDAISKILGKRHLTGREKLVIIRLRRDGSTGLAKPCQDCQQILEALNFKDVWYSTSTGWEKLGAC